MGTAQPKDSMEQLTLQQTALLNRYHRIHAAWLKAELYEMDVMLCAAYASALDLCLNAGINPFDYPECSRNGATTVTASTSTGCCAR